VNPSSNESKGETQAEAVGQDLDRTPHPIVARILDESGQPRETLVVLGYLGSPDDEDRVRIYLDLKFQAYFEIPWNKIIYVGKPDPLDETKPTRIVVDATAQLTLVQTVGASFLRGAITRTHAIGTPAAFALLAGNPVIECTAPFHAGGVVVTRCFKDGDDE